MRNFSRPIQASGGIISATPTTVSMLPFARGSNQPILTIFYPFHNSVKLIYIQVQLHWGFAPHAYILTTIYNTMITCPKMVQKSEASWGECNRERTKSHSSWYLTLGCWLSPCRLLLAHFTRSTIQLYKDDKSHWFHIPRFYVQVLNGASCQAFIYNQFLTKWEWQFLWLGLQLKHDLSWNRKEKKNIYETVS